MSDGWCEVLGTIGLIATVLAYWFLMRWVFRVLRVQQKAQALKLEREKLEAQALKEIVDGYLRIRSRSSL